MADRVYPSTKQNGTTAPAKTTAAAATASNHPTSAATINNPPNQFPTATKTNLYNPMRPPYRPTPTTSRNRRNFSCRRCFCLSCFWAILILIGILLLAAIAAAAFYVLYHPHRPAFSVTSVKISYFNLTTLPSDDTTHLTTKINLTISAKNPNKKAIFYYDPISITVLSQSVLLSNGSYPNSFTNSPDTIFIIHTSMALNSQVLDVDSVNSLKSDLKRTNGLPVKIVLDTIMGVKLEKLKMKKIGIRVKCDGIKGLIPKDKNAALANTSNSKCKVDLRIKILKWTF